MKVKKNKLEKQDPVSPIIIAIILVWFSKSNLNNSFISRLKPGYEYKNDY